VRLCIVLIVVCGLGTPAWAQTDTSWTARYARDLGSLRAAIAANHPGAIDAQNPEFARTLARAYEEASALTPEVRDFASFRVALTRFINQFQDAHLSVAFTRQVDSVREAGVIAEYRNERFFVADVHQRYPGSASLMGAEIFSCDGVSIRDVFRSRVLWWRGRENVEADWHRQAPQLFIDYGPPTPPAPRSCTFGSGGRTITQQLAWRTTPAAAIDAVLQRASAPVEHRLGTERVAPDRFWVRLPTFSANQEPQLSAMRATLDSLRAFVRSTPAWRTIVLALRGNSGGSSSWGDEIAGILFGDEWRRQATSYLFDGVYTEWRLSADNIRAMRGIQEQIARRTGAGSESERQFRTFVDSAEAQFKRGSAYSGTPQLRGGVPAPPPMPVPGRIVVITTPSCFSACLDFLDRLRLHPAVIQVGQTTGVDTNYMEVWGGPISELTWLNYPLKVYRNRRRGNNEAYPPHVRYNGSFADEAQLRDFVLNLK
jgi:hypothetical protein